MENGIEAWAFSASQYIQSVVKNVEEYLKKRVMGGGPYPPKLKHQYDPHTAWSWMCPQSLVQRMRHITNH